MRLFLRIWVALLLTVGAAYAQGFSPPALSPNSLAYSQSPLFSRGNTKVAILGDSRVEQNLVPSVNTASSVEYTKMAQGWITWLQFLTGSRFDFDFADNYGVSGDTTAQLLARLPTILATSQARTGIILIGTNDAVGNVPFATMQSNMLQIVNLMLKSGWTPIIIAELPRGDATNTSARLAANNLRTFQQYTQWLKTLRLMPGVFVFDARPAWDDPASTTGDVVSATFTRDGLHQNAVGAYWIGQSGVALINSLFPPVNILPTANSNSYDATYNPRGCLNSNPMMTGTGGTFNSGASGVTADNWSESGTPTWTRTYSKSTLASGAVAQQVVLGGTGTTASVSLRQVITAGNLTIGDRVQAVAAVEVSPNATNLSQLSLQILDNTTITSRDFGRSVTGELWPTVSGTISGVMRTPVYTLTSTTVQLQMFMVVINAVTPSATIKFGQACLYKVL